MDKYEYNLKLEEIDKLVDQGDYQEAAKLADTVDWKRVRNVRTLCLISEIYEAAGRLEDSKGILERVYKRSPVGRTVLYRLVEVTTALQQYDEAIEYYTEYVQAAPHDNNRYILKYKIYKGRGSSVEELIAILEEYLGQEYTERWAYELATLYQQSGQMQKCFAACDDLVLWFHSGKYVRKALELKRRYAALTPRQQQIYEECLEEKLEEELPEPEYEDSVIRNVESTDGEVIAESIMAETEKEIADQVSAHKAELDKVSQGAQEEDPSDIGRTKEYVRPKETEKGAVQDEPGNGAPKNLQVELAKSMRKIISGVVKHNDESEDDIPASVDSRNSGISRTTEIEVPRTPERTAGQLSIDDILLSMGDKGRKIADTVLGQEAERSVPEEHEDSEADTGAAAEPLPAVDEAQEEPQGEPLPAEAQTDEEPPEDVQQEREEEEYRPEKSPVRNMTEAAREDLTETQREALQYTSNPERLLRNRSALPKYFDEPEDLGRTRRIGDSREDLKKAVRQDILSEKTLRIPAEEISRRIDAAMPPETRRFRDTGDRGQNVEDGSAAEQEAETAEDGADSVQRADGRAQGAQTSGPEFPDGEQVSDETYRNDADTDDLSGVSEEYEEEEYLTIPQYLRGLFDGFTEVEGLEDQIANAILQAESKGTDRTSRNGNILIFGAHGSGKTTLAMALAKAIAQDRGSQVLKVAKIYAADLNRKDIAATIAKVAGGTLIVEEAGDLTTDTVEQLTTAMEFRTDGLIVILEDEQQYIHELLMRHPRFTMKFTAQIYIPEYTVEELAVFGRIHANAQDYVIGPEGYEVFCQIISAGNADGTPMTISDVTSVVDRAIARSSRFFRKISMGKKRYDENDYVILFPKDFKH